MPTNTAKYDDGKDRQFCMAYLDYRGNVRGYYSPFGCGDALDCAALTVEEANEEGMKFARQSHSMAQGIVDWRSHEYGKPAPKMDPSRYYKVLPLHQDWKND